MALFKYKVKDKEGQIVEEVLQASSRKEAAALLKSEENQILSIKDIKQKGVIFGGGISTSEKAVFCRFMATMLKAGLPLPEAIEIIRQETQSKKETLHPGLYQQKP